MPSLLTTSYMRAPRVQYIKPFYYPYRPPWIVIPINITPRIFWNASSALLKEFNNSNKKMLACIYINLSYSHEICDDINFICVHFQIILLLLEMVKERQNIINRFFFHLCFDIHWLNLCYYVTCHTTKYWENSYFPQPHRVAAKYLFHVDSSPPKSVLFENPILQIMQFMVS